MRIAPGSYGMSGEMKPRPISSSDGAARRFGKHPRKKKISKHSRKRGKKR